MKRWMIVGLVVSVWTAPARSHEALRPALAELCVPVAKYLQKHGNSIAIGAFTGPERRRTSSGPAIKLVLIEELEKLKVRVQSAAQLELKGEYLDVVDEHSNLLSLRLKATIVDTKAKTEILVLSKEIQERDVLARLLGVTRADLGAGLTAKAESAAYVERLEKPTVAIQVARVQAAARRPYALEVQVKKTGGFQPLRPTGDEFAFVSIPRGETFAVNLINDSEHDAAVELTLDGLSAFAFSEQRGYRHFIVPRKSQALIQGWHRTNEESNAFTITDYSKSAVAELVKNPDSVDIGTITATFAAAWDPKEKVPEDEGSKFRDPFNAAVGRGEVVKSPYKEVVRQHGRIRDIVSVRYKKATQ